MKPIIYYIDDEPFNLTVFEAALPTEWDIRTFDNPAEALDEIKHNEPWVVVSDQRMPRMKGVELLSEVRALWPKSVRMIVTGFSDESLIIDSVRKAQIFDYIRKPWDSDDLEARIHAAIQQYQGLNSSEAKDSATESAVVAALENKIQELTTLSAAMAHDLLEPLRTVKSYIQSSKEVVEGNAAENLNRAERVLGRMSDGARAILKLLQGSGGNSQEIEKPLSEVLRDVETDLSDSLNVAGMRLDMNAVHSVLVPYHSLRFVLQNLISNAIRYGGKSGESIEIRTEETENGTTILVRDRGPGMDASTKESCKQPFVRGSGKTASGFGAGLATCQLLVSKLGGQLEVVSRLGEGTTFMIHLKCVKEAQDGPQLRLVS